jgi:hypothetical protein
VSYSPTDLLTDADLVDYEADLLTTFGLTSTQGKRTKALEDWLFPILKSRGFDPNRLRTRAECNQVWGYTGSAYSDKTSASSDITDDDLNLATIFATVGTDALYLGSTQTFRGLFVRMLDTVSAVAGITSVAYWNGNWENVLIADGTQQTAGIPFSGGGSITWLLPADWATRTINASKALYFVKVMISATPTAAKAGQIGVIRGSCLRAPAAFRTLQLIFSEAQTSQDGPWRQKAEFYKDEADLALQRALLICGGEFDSDASDLISETEAEQTTESVSGGPWTLERA